MAERVDYAQWDVGAWSADPPIRMVRHVEQRSPDGRRNLLLDV